MAECDRADVGELRLAIQSQVASPSKTMLHLYKYSFI